MYYDNFKGEFESHIRFSYTLTDTTIYSEPLKFKIDSAFVLEPHDRLLSRVDNYLMDENLNDDLRKKYTLRKANIYLAKHNYLEAINILRELINQNPQFHDALYVYATSIVRYLSKAKNLTKSEEFCVISKAVYEWSKIPHWHDKFDDACKYLKIYKEYLPTKSEWLNLNISNCKLFDGKYECYIGKYLDENVIIQFKEE